MHKFEIIRYINYKLNIMNPYFIYLLIVKSFCDQCKIGSTQDPYSLPGRYGGNFSSEPFEIKLIQFKLRKAASVSQRGWT